MEPTLQKSGCKHVNKSLKEETYRTEDGKDIRWKTVLWGCTKCDATSTEPFPDLDDEPIDHTTCGGPSVCFGCKVRTLQLSTGDASGNKNMSQKKWDKELNLYKSAREQGIQPAGTSLKQVQKAIDDSNKVGKAYDANTGGFKG
jgi:hypothetical protein